ncbi:unnamed protein product [Cylindrotheca closterium]|uniref:HSF-type DNA-binding domain-containing protein n=1 Tax=Cylindrotheca closterium TaxID=2856 RepID=A0AAD2CPG6_9STRA|nr:unnamed protein product [Cylindrotheca closterium]
MRIPNEISAQGASSCQKPQFPLKLHAILEETEAFDHHAIISWLPNGLGFKVHDKDAFEEQVMPKYFRTNKFKAFQRNLNLWGFQTLTRDPDRGAAFHPHFIRGKPDECSQMERVRVKKEMKHKKVILTPTGELEPLWSSSSQSSSHASFLPAFPTRSQRVNTAKVISVTSTPPLEPGVSPKCIPPSLSLPRKVSLHNRNAVSNKSSFPLNLQNYSDTPVSPERSVRLDLSFQQRYRGCLPDCNAVSKNSVSLNVQALQDYFALECLRVVSTRATLFWAGNSGSSLIEY